MKLGWRSVNQEEYPFPICEPDCSCPTCVKCGQIVGVIISEGMIQILRDRGGTFVWYAWAEPPLRKPVELRSSRDGLQLVPVARGERRARIVRDLAEVLPMAASDRRGPNSKHPPARIIAVVNHHRLRRMTLVDAQAEAAQSLGVEIETVRKAYKTDDSISNFLAHRRMLRNGPNKWKGLHDIWHMEVPVRDVADLVRWIMRRRGLTTEEAAGLISEQCGWPPVSILLTHEACHQGSSQQATVSDSDQSATV